MLADLDTLSQLAENQTLSPYMQDGKITLDELINITEARSPEIISSNLNIILQKAEHDQFQSVLFPQIDLSLTYGRSAFIRREEIPSNYRISPTLRWNIFRYFEIQKTREAFLSAETAKELQLLFVKKQNQLKIINLYLDWVGTEILITKLELLKSVIKSDLQQLNLFNAVSTESPSLYDLEQQLAEIERSLNIANAQYITNKVLIQTLTGLADLTVIERPTYEMFNFTPTPLTEYITESLAKSEGLEASKLLSFVASKEESKEKIARFSGITFFSSLTDILTNLSSNIISITWAYDLIDQGNFNRKLLKARANKLLADLEVNVQHRTVYQLAGDVWISTLDATIDFHELKKNRKKQQINYDIASRQLSTGYKNPSDVWKIETELKISQHDEKIAYLELARAISHYETLTSGEVTKWNIR